MLASRSVATGVKALAVGHHKGCWEEILSALEAAGFEVARAPKISGARAAFAAHDLVLLDLSAKDPEETDKLISWLREESGRPLYLLGVGAVGATSREALVAKLRLNDLVALPLDPEALRQRLVSFDRWRRLRFHQTAPATSSAPSALEPFFTGRHGGRAEDPARIWLRETPIGVAMLNRSLRYVLANRRWREQFDMGDRELTGRSHLELFPNLHAAWKPIYEACLQGEIRRGSESLTPSDSGPGGELRWEIRPWHNGSGHIGGITIFFEEVWDRPPPVSADAPSGLSAATESSPGPAGAEPATRAGTADIESAEPGKSTGPQNDPGIFSEILEQLSTGIVLLDADGKLVYANRRHADLLGRPVTSAGKMETWLAEGCPDPSQRERLLDSWRTDVWQRQVTRVYALRHTEGSTRLLRIHPQLLLPENRLLLTLSDVTEDKRQEQALRNSEMRFRALFRDSGVGIALTDASHSLHDINPALEDMLGLSKRSLRGTSFADLVHPGDRTRLEEELEQMRTSCGRHLSLDLRLLRSNSGPDDAVWARVQICAVRDAQKELLFEAFFVHDETAERIVRAELEICQEQNRALLKAAPGLIILTDRAGEIIEWVEGEPAAVPRPDLESGPMTIEEAIPAFRGRSAALIAEAYDGGTEVRIDFDHQSETSVVPCRARVVACRPRDAVIFIQSAVETPGAASSPSPDGQFLTDVHDRLRNNLQIVHALVNLPFQDDRTLVPWNALPVTRNRIRALYLVHQLLRIEDGKERIDFRKFAEGHAANLIESFHATGRIRFHAEFETEQFDLSVASPLALIFNEMVSNSIQHGFPGDTRGSVLGRIRRDDENRLALSVIDDGLGLRGAASEVPHSGLGFKLIQRLAQRIGGSFEEAESSETEFVVYFTERVGE
ncbi:MAG TPA: PAS domain S-box protein [Verrucomicrobiales bacterium]|nr:PAS domain S-box protein [Verrucomicrobiales bacterium]